MGINVSGHLFFWTTISILVTCMVMIAIFSGFEHEAKKFKTLLVTVVLVLLFQYIFGDPIKFTLLAIDAACWPPKQRKFATDREATHHNRLDYLKLRLASLKSQLLLTQQHRNEKLNEKYKNIAQDLWLYGKYFFFLLLIVLVTRDSYRYYNTSNLKELFLNNHSRFYGLSEVYHLNQLYIYIEEALIDAFDANFSIASDAGVTGWLHAEQSKMLGVVRLRQVRLDQSKFGLNDPDFTKQEFMPRWELPYKRMHFTDKYWRIYEPWLPMREESDILKNYLLFNWESFGYFVRYPEAEGYVTVLARNRQNSMKILEYLDKHNWLNYNTSALFIDFTLYNVDVNIFSVCTLYVEQTPFGSLLPHVEVDSVKLLENLDQLDHLDLVVLLMYMLVLIQFSKALVLKIWYDRTELRSIWNKIDLFIFVVNLTVLLLIVTREWLVANMLKKVEGASKMEFIDFRLPTRLHNLTTIIIGFLICITTLRLWKILQFASVFQLFTHTLSLAWKAVASTAIVIAIFLIAFGIAVDTINGNNSVNFNKLIKSIATCMCFSFGYSSQITPEDLFFGGEYLGVLLYSIMAFVIAVLLINVFVSLINDYFTTAKAKHDQARADSINFIQFLRIEYGYFFRIFAKLRIFRRAYYHHNRTVSENIRKELEDQELKRKRRRHLEDVEPKSEYEEHMQHEKYKRKLERMYTVAAILQTQLEILDRLLFENDSELRPPQ